MSDATGAGGARGSARTPEDELPDWPDDGDELPIGDEPTAADAADSGVGQVPPTVPDDARSVAVAPAADSRGMSAAPVDDIRGMSAAPVDDIRGMSYEQARDELIRVVDRLERGGSTLEESLALWERGEALAARCEAWLTGARARLEAARAGAQARDR